MTNRIIGVKGSERTYDIYVMENSSIGNPQTASSVAGITNIDTSIPNDFYPKVLSVALTTTNALDYVEIFIVDGNGNVIRKLASSDYLATNVFSFDFADLRDHIPSFIFSSQLKLRIAFNNVTGTSYLISSSWELWMPTGT